LRLTRSEKRNALDDATVLGLETFFSLLPKEIRAVVLTGIMASR
jgi:(methylthio)acryloyl-CoA hydratase